MAEIMIFQNPQPDRQFPYPYGSSTRWANAKPERWWREASPKARGRLHQRRYDPEYNAAQAFLWMLDKRHWRRHPEPWNKSAAGLARRHERLFAERMKMEGLS